MNETEFRIAALPVLLAMGCLGVGFCTTPVEAQGAFGARRLIETRYETRPWQMRAADLDGDGHVDLIAAFHQEGHTFEVPRLLWYQNLGDGTLTGGKTIHASNEYFEHAGCDDVADLDGDGDLDLLSSSEHQFAIFENVDGQGRFGPPIPVRMGSSYSSLAFDCDADGDLDIIQASERGTVWLKNIGDLHTFEIRYPLPDVQVQDLHACDVNGDGYEDIIVASLFGMAWYSNTPSGMDFTTPHSFYDERAYALASSDIDGDGDEDLVARVVDYMLWFENVGGLPGFGSGVNLTTYPRGTSVSCGDLDEDGDMDVLAGGSWYENIDGQGDFGARSFSPTGGVESVLVDIDGDGDEDIACGSRWHAGGGYDPVLGMVGWCENGVGTGFSEERMLEEGIHFRGPLLPGDLDGDGDQDLVAVDEYSDQVVVYELSDGSPGLMRRQVLDTGENLQPVAALADLNGDDVLDLLTVEPDTVVWYPGCASWGGFETVGLAIPATMTPRCVLAHDFDGDGDVDLALVGGDGFWGYRLVWFANLDGTGTFSNATIVWESFGSITACAADYDEDGFVDLVAAEAPYVSWGEVKLFRSLGPSGGFSAGDLIGTYGGPALLASADFDANGTEDLIVSLRGTEPYYTPAMGLMRNMGGGFFGYPQGWPEDHGAHSAAWPVDTDGDGDLDLLFEGGGPYGYAGLTRSENLDGLGTYGGLQEIDGIRPTMCTLDLDRDGDDDLIVSAWEGLAWRETAAASAASRNAGDNPASLRAMRDPLAGRRYACSVDLAGTTGHSFCVLLGTCSPLEYALPGGQVLMVDPRDTRWRMLRLPTELNPLAKFHFMIPDDPRLVGLGFSTQAVHLGGQPFELSNAQDLVFGF